MGQLPKTHATPKSMTRQEQKPGTRREFCPALHHGLRCPNAAPAWFRRIMAPPRLTPYTDMGFLAQ